MGPSCTGQRHQGLGGDWSPGPSVGVLGARGPGFWEESGQSTNKEAGPFSEGPSQVAV